MIHGKGESDKKAYEYNLFGAFIHLTKLHKGNVYRQIYPLFDKDIHKFNSLLQ